MKYFLDTEFFENGSKNPIELISIALVAEDGREFYAINSEFDWKKASNWLKKNVMPQVTFTCEELVGSGASPRRRKEETRRMPPVRIAREVLEFCNTKGNPEFIGYYADYDWVVFCQLFGSMMDLPVGWPMYCKDLKQMVDELLPNTGLPDLPESIEHHALYDAREIKYRYKWLLDTSFKKEMNKIEMEEYSRKGITDW